jgi:hypothetical protein
VRIIPGQGRRTGLQSIPMLIDRREGETPAFQQGFLHAASQEGLQPLRCRSPCRRVGHGSTDPLQVVLHGAAANLMTKQPGIETVGQGVIETAEHHAATGEGFDRWQTEALTHPRTPPIIG